MHAVEKRTGTWRSAHKETLWSVRIEAKHPIPHDLQRDAADPGRVGAGGAIIDCRQSEEAPGLIRITRALGQGPKIIGVVVGSERDRGSHGDLRASDRPVNQTSTHCGMPRESVSSGFGINPTPVATTPRGMKSAGLMQQSRALAVSPYG